MAAADCSRQSLQSTWPTADETVSNQDLSKILVPPQKRSLADEVTVSIREAITSGRLAPGERLREESLASFREWEKKPDKIRY